MQNNDTWTLGGHTFTSRFILGSGKYKEFKDAYLLYLESAK